jgi:group I intron endonuclease
MNNNYIAYMHTSPSDKRYIGITSQKPERRWRKDGYGYKDHIYFWRAIQKYGWVNFKHEILFDGLTKEEAEKKEIELIAYYNSNNENYGYNLSSGGESGSKGYKHTEEQRNRMSQNRKGEKNAMYGKHHTEETKQKERMAHLRDNLSQDTLYKMSVAKKGKKRSIESIKKQIDTISNKVICIETSVIYNSIKEAGMLNNIDSSCISKVCRGKRKTAGGFHWCYGD